jgi:hypothetical protein
VLRWDTNEIIEMEVLDRGIYAAGKRFVLFVWIK